MHLNFLFQNIMHRVKLTLLIQVNDFFLIFAPGDVENELFPGESMSLVEGASCHLLSWNHFSGNDDIIIRDKF